MDQQEALLCLCGFAGMGTREILEHCRRAGGLEEAVERLGKGALDWWAEEQVLCRKHGTEWITLLDESYPQLLREISSPPPVLYLRGKLPQEESPRCIAVVGSRHVTAYGLRMARRLGRELAECGIVVISGLALGADAEAHRGCLEAKGRTVAVLGNGLASIHPRSNENLAGAILKGGGALVSEFPMKALPYASHFPRRNRIISGLCRGVVVVEAMKRSGALITARLALEQNREVFAVPGAADSALSSGPHHLLRDGAALVESVEDILRVLEWREAVQHVAAEARGGMKKKEDTPLLKPQAMRIMKALSSGPMGPDTLSEVCGISTGRLAETMLDLEIRGLVRSLPGPVWEAGGNP
ncbi:MAG: DNA-processing protein DprA [Candidatus Omnitrophica bacterium]|nr:DNA-processing protein DprA [Candidatus Omnitrophota bacterium]